MKKQLNVSAITNELRGNSAFFPRYKKEPAADPVPDLAPLPSNHQQAPAARPLHPGRVVPPVPLVPPVPGVPPIKRVMKHRWPVDIYQDQYESLQELALEERKQGGIGSMSAMVRQALDELIAKKRSSKK